jgi:hypothetical protein
MIRLSAFLSLNGEVFLRANARLANAMASEFLFFEEDKWKRSNSDLNCGLPIADCG